MFSTALSVWSRFVRISSPYLQSTHRRQAFGLLAALLGLLLTLSGLNVVISYVGRDFMTAISERRSHDVFGFALAYLGVFAASTVAGAFAQYAELMLGLRWREWLTRRFFHAYLSSHAYHRLNAQSEVDNPDERIAEDLKTFTTTTLSFLVMATNSAITIVAFIGVLWSITPWLVIAGYFYPLIGTLVIVYVGRRLVKLNHQQLKMEADFRYELVQIRTHAEAIALDQAEAKQDRRLSDRLDALVANYASIIHVLRNLKFVSGGYNYLNQLIPLFIVAPLYLEGRVEFGVVTQSAMAFSQIFNAFSLIAERFQDLSAYAAVIGRVGALEEAISAAEPSQRPLQVVEAAAPVTSFQRVTLKSPHDDQVLAHDLSLEIPRGSSVLVTGRNSDAERAFFRATAGLWDKGTGQICHAAPRRVLFLPERPYLMAGSLRAQFNATTPRAALTDERILQALEQVGLAALIPRVGGLNTERDWATALSLEDQQRLAFARLLLAEPDVAFLDHAASALNDAGRAELYQLLGRRGLTFVSVGDHSPSLGQYHLTQLELRPDGTWAAKPIEAEKEIASNDLSASEVRAQ
jgi:putative ATP-binding cassette transporter